MPIFLAAIVAAALATVATAAARSLSSDSPRSVYGIVPNIPTSSFLDEQREIFRAEFQPVEVFTPATPAGA